MAKRIVVLVAAAGLIALVLLGCGEREKPVEYRPEIDPNDFITVVDNNYFPLKTGTVLIYEGDTGQGPERVEVSVTSDTKEILGVDCTVVRDTVTVGGELAEDTFDWYAQDKEGNVWYFGEDSKEYEDGKVVSTKGSWEAGVDGAQPGIIMKAEPVVGEKYRQEYDKGNAEDMAEVVSLTESVTVRTGSYDKCLKTREWTPLDPGAEEYKYYAPGIGQLLETPVEDESQRIELVEVKTTV